MMIKLKNQRGQSLVEVLVAASVGVLILTALVIATTHSIKGSRFSRDQAVASQLAQEKIEELRNRRDEEGWQALLQHTHDYGAFNINLMNFDRRVTGNTYGSDSEFCNITVTVSWTDNGQHEVLQKMILSRWKY